jgi:hypothetical protein
MLLPADLTVFKPITDREILILQRIADGWTSAAHRGRAWHIRSDDQKSRMQSEHENG